MSHLNKGLEPVKAARRSLKQFHLKVLSPSVAILESGTSDLADALEYLNQVQPALAAPGSRSGGLERSLRSEIVCLQRELEQAKVLMECVSKFYDGWARLSSSASDEGAANYTLFGKPGTLPPYKPSNVVIHG